MARGAVAALFDLILARWPQRGSFYRFEELYGKGGELALQQSSRRKPIPKNRTPPDIEQAAVELANRAPILGQGVT